MYVCLCIFILLNLVCFVRKKIIPRGNAGIFSYLLTLKLVLRFISMILFIIFIYDIKQQKHKESNKKWGKLTDNKQKKARVSEKREGIYINEGEKRTKGKHKVGGKKKKILFLLIFLQKCVDNLISCIARR